VIAEGIMEIVISVLLMGVSFLGGAFLRSVKKGRSRQEAIEEGLRALLRDSIIHECDRCTERGYMHIHNLESVDDMSKMYYALGGNGAVKKLVEDFKKLEVR